MKTDKGYMWASDYWSNIVLQEASNSIKTGSSYGNRGNTNWQIIVLAEGWAYYREEYLRRIYLEQTYNKSTTSFPYTYINMFRELRTIGCSFINIEKSLCTYSINGFRDNLIAKYPNLRIRITEITEPYL
ncbi:MAG: hypothetical protein LBR10_13625 [Prevotellaceae bacterium]|jgi:hypothetical protein|nr:hypothetical protein [Prevotellaceae bacterium]